MVWQATEAMGVNFLSPPTGTPTAEAAPMTTRRIRTSLTATVSSTTASLRGGALAAKSLDFSTSRGMDIG